MELDFIRTEHTARHDATTASRTPHIYLMLKCINQKLMSACITHAKVHMV